MDVLDGLHVTLALKLKELLALLPSKSPEALTSRHEDRRLVRLPRDDHRIDLLSDGF